MIKKKNPVIEAIYFILCTHNHTTGKGSKKKIISFWSTEENACIVEPRFRKQMNKKRLGDLGR